MFSVLRTETRSINFIRIFTNARNASSTIQGQIEFSNGRKLQLSSGKYARLANGVAECKMGDTAVMVTAVARDKPSSGNFMPLTVDYRQKYAAAGRIPMNFFRRELGKSDKEILTGRLIDRSIRPLFDQNFRCETQIVCNPLALDAVNLPEVLCINAASLALSLSDIPWNGPVSAVQLGLIDNETVINPTRKQLKESDLDLILVSTKKDLVVMLEGKSNDIEYQKLSKSIRIGLVECRKIIEKIEALQKEYGKEKRPIEEPKSLEADVKKAIRAMSEMRVSEVFQNHSYDKMGRDNAINEIRQSVVDKVWSSYPDVDANLLGEEFNKISKEIFRNIIFQNERCDGRQLNELRNISCKVDLYEPLHGSALFQRGQTQVMTTVSLDSIEHAIKLDSLSALDAGAKTKNFFLHYEFPPYATGEVGRVGGANRREIGHGALAEKALLPVIPSDYPFAIRLTSEVLESNGSSSMATVCAGSMALMNAGVPITKPVAGVAMGLVTKYNEDDPYQLDDYRILTDILGIEDYLGDMDMKLAWTKQGITAIQADIKTIGIPLKVIVEAIEGGSQAKSKILSIMSNCISDPQKAQKYCWPVVDRITIEGSKRLRLLGNGALNLKKIFLETGAQLTQMDDMKFRIFAPSQAAMDEAMEMINKVIEEEPIAKYQFGEIYTAKIVDILEAGILVKLYETQTPTFIHRSQLSDAKVANPQTMGFEVGQEIPVKFYGFDQVSGYMRLSRKAIGSTNDVVDYNNK